MRSSITILLLVIVTHGWGQDQQPVYLGVANWVKSPVQHGPDSLPVTVTKYKMTKTVTADNKPSVFQRKIDPGTRVIRTGPIVPVTESVQYTGKKLIVPPRKFDAPPLLIRDNAEFNISYTDNQHGFIGKNSIHFTEDDQHNIWISSDEGLIRYDGYHYFLYSAETGITKERPLSLAYDKQKRLWLSSENGVSFIRNDSVFTLKSKEIDFSTVACVQVLVDANDRVWLSTKKNGAICVDGSTIRVFDSRCGLPSDYVMNTLLDKKGNLWIASHDSGVVVIEPDRMRQFFNRSNPIGRNQFFCLYEDDDGMWMGGYFSGFMRIGKTDTLQYSLNGKFNERFYDIKKAPRGGLWLCSFGSSISYFTKKDLVIMNASNGLVDRNCQYLFEDSFGNIWVNNIQTGFSRINENSFYIGNFPNPAVAMVKTIIPDNKNGRWLLTYGRNTLYQKGNTVTTYTYSKNNYQPFLFHLEGVLNKDGTLWLGNFGEGMVLVDDPYFSTYHFSSSTETQVIRSVKTDGENRVWFCPTDFGLIMYDQKRFWHYTTESGLLSNRAAQIYIGPKQQIYLGIEPGIQRLTEKGFETLFIGDKQLEDELNCILIINDSTTLYGTTDNGLMIIRNNKAYHLKVKTDLTYNRVKSVIRDAQGKIWISTNKGIESFFMDDLTIRDHRIFNETNGPYLSTIESTFLDSAGIPSWLAREKKIVYNPDFSMHNKSPVFSIKEISVDNKIADLTKKISILPNQKVSINFTSIFWGRENNLKIKYLLISNNGDTSERVVDSRGNIVISEVAPGNYRIVLTGTDNNIVYTHKPLLLQINNFWYNTWLFRICMLGLLVSGIIIYFRRKSKQQKKINEMLEVKVAEQTQVIKNEKEQILKNYQVIDLQNREKDILIQEINHRVKNNLQIITAMVEMQINSDNKNDAEQSLRGTARRLSAMSLVHEMLYENKNVQGLSLKKYFEELVEHLKEMASNTEKPIHFDLATEDIIIDSRSAISLGMIISELVSNSIKHAFQNVPSPKLTVNLTRDPVNGYLRLLVGDNGNGIAESDNLKKGLGSRLVDIFSRQLNGTYTINSTDQFVFILLFKPPGT